MPESIETLIRDLSIALRVRAMYAADHASAQQAFKRLFQTLQGLLDERKEVRIGAVGGALVGEGLQSDRTNAVAASLVRLLSSRQIDMLIFQSGVTAEELGAFLDVMAIRPADLKEEGIPAILSRRGVTRIAAGQIDLSGEAAAPLPADADLSAFYRGGVAIISEVIREFSAGNRAQVSLAKEIVGGIVGAVEKDLAALPLLATLRNHDDYTFTHALNVGVLTVAQAKSLALPERDLFAVGIAGLLHDLGKQRIPPEILGKPALLTDDEFALMQMHPIYGAEAVRNVGTVPDLVTTVAFEHHLGIDFSGYPRLGRRWTLNLASRLTTIADSFDALRTNRPYRSGITIEQAFDIMRAKRGSLYDPELFDNFERLIKSLAGTGKGGGPVTS